MLLNSTWNPESLFGDGGGDDVLPSLLPRLASEFPADEYRFAAVLHPNIWHGHGPGQIRAWLDRAQRAGLALIDPLHGWRQALIAADAVIGDHGSVTYYAAALGTPVLLGPLPSPASRPRHPSTTSCATPRGSPRPSRCVPSWRRPSATTGPAPKPPGSSAPYPASRPSCCAASSTTPSASPSRTDPRCSNPSRCRRTNPLPTPCRCSS